MTDSELLQDIRELAARHSGCKLDIITPDVRLLQDLGLDGDDAEMFFAAFAQAYDVDIPDLHWPRYFGPEEVSALLPWLFVGRKQDSVARRQWRAALDAEREIDIAHLVRIAKAGVWSDPGPEHAIRPEDERKSRWRFDRRPVLFWMGALLLCLMAAAIVLSIASFFWEGLAALRLYIGLHVATIALAYLTWRQFTRALVQAAEKVASIGQMIGFINVQSMALRAGEPPPEN